jgi:hypothetical protein
MGVKVPFLMAKDENKQCATWHDSTNNICGIEPFRKLIGPSSGQLNSFTPYLSVGCRFGTLKKKIL